MAIKRQSVIDAIVTALGNVTVAGGYYNTFTNKVKEQGSQHPDTTEFPFVNVIESGNESASALGGNNFYENHILTVDVEITDGSNSYTMAHARKLVMDTVKAMRTVKYGGVALDGRYIKDTIEMDVNETITVTVKVTFEFLYRSEMMKES